MKKKLLAICLSAAMIVGIAGCAPKAPTSEEGSKRKDYKIGIITGTVSQGEEEYRAAENMKNNMEI